MIIEPTTDRNDTHGNLHLTRMGWSSHFQTQLDRLSDDGTHPGQGDRCEKKQLSSQRREKRMDSQRRRPAQAQRRRHLSRHRRLGICDRYSDLGCVHNGKMSFPGGPPARVASRMLSPRKSRSLRQTSIPCSSFAAWTGILTCAVSNVS